MGGHTLQRPPSHVPPLRGPVAYGLPVHAWAPRDAASGPIRARLTSFLSKLSQNGKVSPEYVEKASHSPYSQNRLGKSALGFLRFPLWPAFSHKELMAYFDPYSRFLVKTTKCRPNVHTRGRSDTPTVMRNKLLLHDRSSSDLAGCRIDLFPDILNEVNIY